MKEWGKRIFKSHPKGARFDPNTFRSPNPSFNHFTIDLFELSQKIYTYLHTLLFFVNLLLRETHRYGIKHLTL